MRYLSHQFAHWETLARVRSWLDLLGFDPARIEVSAGALPRMTVLVEPEQVLEVRQLMDAAEQSDPDGWPSFWQTAPAASGRSGLGTRPSCGPRMAPDHFEIGWHPHDRNLLLLGEPMGLAAMASRAALEASVAAATEQAGLRATG